MTADAEFATTIRRQLEPHDEAVRVVSKYFQTDHRSGRRSYTGAYFDRLEGGGGIAPDRIGPSDLVAITMLRVRVEPEVAADLLDGDLGGRASELLADMGPDDDLWRTPLATYEGGSPASDLWDLLESQPGIGWVTANKLMARKRPRMIPVYDTVVSDALKPGRNRFWIRLWHALHGTPDLVAQLESIRNDAGDVDDISLLRILDIVVWMRNLGDGQVEDHEGG